MLQHCDTGAQEPTWMHSEYIHYMKMKTYHVVGLRFVDGRALSMLTDKVGGMH